MVKGSSKMYVSSKKHLSGRDGLAIRLQTNGVLPLYVALKPQLLAIFYIFFTFFCHIHVTNLFFCFAIWRNFATQKKVDGDFKLNIEIRFVSKIKSPCHATKPQYHMKKNNPLYIKKKAMMGTHPQEIRSTRQIKAQEHMSEKNITIKTSLIH